MDKTGNHHIKHITILVLVALVVGIYLIGATVVISKDSVKYIERAEKLPEQLHTIMNLNEPFGFPVLIAGFHKLSGLDDSPKSWILAGQICVLTSRLLAIVVLYLFGTVLFNARDSFWAVLVLIVLPWPAAFGADILREWPHLLFLFTGLLLLYRGIHDSSAVWLFAAGLISALGYIIRPECAQVVLYGLVFFVLNLVSNIHHKQSIRKDWIYLGLLIGFLVVFVPYTLQLDKKVPDKLEHLFLDDNEPMSLATPTRIKAGILENAGLFDVNELFEAIVHLLSGVVENLMYYFAFPAALGFYLLFIKSSEPYRTRRLLIGFFLGFYIIVLILLYLQWGYISRRHVLPISVMLCFYIPFGIRRVACWLSGKAVSRKEVVRNWSLILIVPGMLICMPKLLTPLGYNKNKYRQAASWLANNTNPDDRIYTFDKRIPFYADRPYRLYKNSQHFKKDFTENYLITQSVNGQIEIPVPTKMSVRQEFELDLEDRQLLIFKRDE